MSLDHPPEARGGGGRIRWRMAAEGIPPALAMVASPYDPDVHYAVKRATTWVGYKVHLTETCDDAQPPLIVHVATTPAPIVDRAVLDPLDAALARKDLLPARHLIDADGLVAAARDHDIALTEPVPKDTSDRRAPRVPLLSKPSTSTGIGTSQPARRDMTAGAGIQITTSVARSYGFASSHSTAKPAA